MSHYDKEEGNAVVSMTAHAALRMQSRRIHTNAASLVLDYGREVHVRGAVLCAVGRREVRRYAREGVDLSALEGFTLVLSTDRTSLITAYRNRSLRQLRTRSRGCRRRSPYATAA